MRTIQRIITVCLLIITISPNLVGASNFENPLDESLTIEGTANSEVSLIDRLEDIGITGTGSDQIRDTIVFIGVKVMIPIFVLVGVIVAIVGLYKVMTSDKAEDTSKGFNYLLWGTVGIIIMVSAGYITNQLIGTAGDSGIIGGIEDTPAGAKIAEQLYLDVLYPFLKIAIIIVLGILFIMVTIHAFQYIFRTDGEFKKKSFTILIYNALGIIVIILAKSMVELVYGKYTTVINENVKSGGEDIGQIGEGVLEVAEFGTLHTVINRVLGLATFVILVLIIYQSYQLLTRPNDEELLAGLKKNLGYTFIGILIIGAGYLLTNFLVIT